MLSSCNNLYLAHRERKYRDPEQSCLYLHLEMSRFSYKYWYCTCCSNKSHSTAASFDSALTRRAHEDLKPHQQCCELGPLQILQISTDASSLGEGAAAYRSRSEPDGPPTQCRQPALHQLCNENENVIIATRIQGSVAQLYSGNTTSTSGEQRKFLTPPYTPHRRGC